MRLARFSLRLCRPRATFSMEPRVKRSKKPREGAREGQRGPRQVGRAEVNEGERWRDGNEPGERERERRRTGTRGIQQLPLNVFNAAVEARKRSVGRSHRSATPRRLRAVGMEPCGPVGAVVFLSLRVLHGLQSLSIYVPGGIAIAGPVKHDPGLPKTRWRGVGAGGWTANVRRSATGRARQDWTRSTPRIAPPLDARWLDSANARGPSSGHSSNITPTVGRFRDGTVLTRSQAGVTRALLGERRSVTFVRTCKIARRARNVAAEA